MVDVEAAGAVDREVGERLRVLAGQVDPRGVERVQRASPSGEIEVANDLPRNGPSGTYSQAWMSRADQSLSPTTPKTWSANASTATGSPWADGAPTTKPSSASMSSRCDRPERRGVVAGRLALPVRPDDRRCPRRRRCRRGRGSRPGRCFQFGSSGSLVGPEDPADVGGVVLGGVEVDVVGDLERQVQRHLGQRHQVRLDRARARASSVSSVGEPAPYRRPRLAALRQERVERRRRRRPAPRRAARRPRPAPGRAPGRRSATPTRGSSSAADEHAVRQVVDVVRRAGSAVDPGASRSVSQSSSSPSAIRSSRGSVTQQEPNEVNHRRAPDRARCRAPSRRSGSPVLLLRGSRPRRRGRRRRRRPGREQDVEEAVVLEAGRRVAVPHRVVQPGGALERQSRGRAPRRSRRPARVRTGRRRPRCRRCGTSAAARPRRPRRAAASQPALGSACGSST